MRSLLLRVLPCLTLLLLAAPSAVAEDADIAKQVDAFMRAYEEASRSRDPDAIRKAFDIEAIVESWERLGYFSAVPEKQKATLLETLKTRLAATLVQPTLSPPFKSFEVRSIRPGSETDTFVVYVRTLDEDDVLSKMFLRLRRRGDQLGLYDVEDLDTGIGMTALVGSLLVEASHGTSRIARSSVAAIQQAQMLVAEDRFAEAYELLTPVAEKDLPDILMALVQIILAGAALGDYELEACVEHATLAEELKPDTPLVHYVRAVAWNLLEEPAKALTDARAYIAKVDEDREINLELGKALYALDRAEEAVAPLRKSAAEKPVDFEALAWLACALPAEKRAEIDALYAKLEDVPGVFAEMAEICVEHEDADALRRLAGLYGKQYTDDFQVPYYEGRALLIDGKTAEAADKLWEALGKLEHVDMDPEDRVPYIEAWLDAMVLQKKHLVAFERGPDRLRTFQYLAADLSISEDPDLLMELVARAGEDEELLPWRRYYTAEVQFLRKQFEQAAKALGQLRKELLPRQEDDEILELLWDVEDRYIRASVRSAGADLDAALVVAQEVAQRDDDYDYVLIVTAHRGDVQATLKALAQAIEHDSDPVWLFQDEDLQEILKGEAFAEARKKYLGE